MLVSFVPDDICWREYEPFTVLYDLRNRQLITLESVAADIWHKIAQDTDCDIDTIVGYISHTYECDSAAIVDDVYEFVSNLYDLGLVHLDGLRYAQIPSTQNVADVNNDVEGEVIQSLVPYNQLYSATFEMTYACNERCIHCYANFPGASQAHNQIPLGLYRGVIDELAEMGCMHLALTGGDPFMYRDFPEVFFYARERGFVCDVYTNGLYLYDDIALLERMAAAQPRAFFISVYGSCAEIHDSVTETAGSFAKTIHVVKRLIELRTPVVLNVMLLSNNHWDLPGIIGLAKELGAEYRVSMSLIRRNDGSDKPMDYFIGDRDAIKDAITTVRDNFYSFDISLNEAERCDYMCGAGVTSISIDPDGLIHPCISLKNVLGDVVNGTIRQAWENPERVRVMDLLRWENAKECMECESRRFCPHCPGMSQAETGDAFACNTCDKVISECIMELEAQQ